MSVKCDYCYKDMRDVVVLVESDNKEHHICGECIDDCQQIVKSSKKVKSKDSIKEGYNRRVDILC